ncbi:MAG: hypothetical protein D6706_03185 [Chloroflexi bacterium]|nr:MAG: hypothetical protein D6706_03185 [Chloroflexota bacterium]
MTTLTIVQSFAAPGPGPVGLAWDGRFLWNADFTAGKIFRIDPATGAATASLVCPGNLSGLAWDGRSLWQSLHDGSALTRINPNTNDFDQTITLHDEGWLSGVAWDGERLWVASQQHGHLLALNRENGEILHRLTIPIAPGDLAWHDGSLWVGIAFPMRFDERLQQFEWEGSEQQYALLQIDPANGDEISRYSLDFLPMGLAWVNDELWLAHAGARKLCRARLD